MWNAAHADGLVIESFSMPPDMAGRGPDRPSRCRSNSRPPCRNPDRHDQYANGQVLRRRLGRRHQGGNSRHRRFHQEAYRFLRRWLGHEPCRRLGRARPGRHRCHRPHRRRGRYRERTRKAISTANCARRPKASSTWQSRIATPSVGRPTGVAAGRDCDLSQPDYRRLARGYA